jgi:hypothetical protein
MTAFITADENSVIKRLNIKSSNKIFLFAAEMCRGNILELVGDYGCDTTTVAVKRGDGTLQAV